MADARMPEKFYELACPMLPPEKEVGLEGGRPPKAHRTVLKVIWFVLLAGSRWKDVPKEMGCCGETARTRMQSWENAGIWHRLHGLILSLMNHQGNCTWKQWRWTWRRFGPSAVATPPVQVLSIAAKRGRNILCSSTATVCR